MKSVIAAFACRDLGLFGGVPDLVTRQLRTILVCATPVAPRFIMRSFQRGCRRAVWCGYRHFIATSTSTPQSTPAAASSFYRVAPDLSSDLEDLDRRLRDRPGPVLVIHYYGFPQPSITELAALCQRHGGCLLRIARTHSSRETVRGISASTLR